MKPEELPRIDLYNLPPNAVAFTRLGRPFNKAAEELDTMLKRRLELISEYEAQLGKTAGLMQELVRCHVRVDQIINEMAPEDLNFAPELNKTTSTP